MLWTGSIEHKINFLLILISVRMGLWGKITFVHATAYKIISQVFEIGKWCDQNGDRVSKNDNSGYICIIWLKRL